MTDTPSLTLLVKLGSIAVHADELISFDGRQLDKDVIKDLLADPEVRQWIASMGALLPVKRMPDHVAKIVQDIRSGGRRR
jgi:hypothetical protein